MKKEYTYEVGDVVTMKKPHPCGSKEWEILRVGADFRLKCMGCGHQIMIDRKSKRTPLNFKIVLALPDDQIPAFLTAHGLTAYRPEDIQGLYLNFHYDGSTLQCITGTSLKTFSMDKSIEREWDTEVKSILKSQNIEGEY